LVVQLLVLPAIINTDSGCWHDQLHNHHTMAASASASSPDLETEGTLEFRDTLTSGDPGRAMLSYSTPTVPPDQMA
jgi:hypothetical protein